MNKQIALSLLAKLASASYLDRTSGIVQVLTRVSEGDGGLPVSKRIPFTSFATHETCNKPESLMIPDSRFKSCLYFEDNGIATSGYTGKNIQFSSRLRLVCWINTIRIAGSGGDTLIAGLIMGDVIKRLTAQQNYNSEPFIRIVTTIENIPPQDGSIFSRYDYDQKTTQYLMAPYDFFALDLRIDFQVPVSCLDDITATNTEPCPPSDAVITEVGALVNDDDGHYVKVEPTP